jgi:hypothetical protein
MDEESHINDEGTQLVIDLVQNTVSFIREIRPDWQKAYVRFFIEIGHSQAKGSYAHQSDIDLIDAIEHKQFFRSFLEKGEDLLAALGKNEGLFLLIVDSNLNYEIFFEYQDMSRWQINKLDGATGIPIGID